MNFYAYLHRVVDEKIGRMLAALGDPGDPSSLRSRTVIARTSDHGELGLSHGGLRQKMFNGYEESIRVPLVVSNPVLFPEPRESDALVSLVDLVPTLLGLSGEPGDAGSLRRASTSAPILAGPSDSVRDAVLFTYDDHQAGTAFQDVPGPAEPDPLRARLALEVRGLPRPHRRAPRPSTSSTTSRPTPTRRLNLVDKHTGRGRDRRGRARAPAPARAARAGLRGERHRRPPRRCAGS